MRACPSSARENEKRWVSWGDVSKTDLGLFPASSVGVLRLNPMAGCSRVMDSWTAQREMGPRRVCTEWRTQFYCRRSRMATPGGSLFPRISASDCSAVFAVVMNRPTRGWSVVRKMRRCPARATFVAHTRQNPQWREKRSEFMIGIPYAGRARRKRGSYGRGLESRREAALVRPEASPQVTDW